MAQFDEEPLYILPPTPEDVLTDYAVDVFEVTIGSIVDSSVKSLLCGLAWNKYRRRPIGDYDYEYWMTSLDDEVSLQWEWYSKIYTKYTSTLGDDVDMLSTVAETDSMITVQTGSGVTNSDGTNNSTTNNSSDSDNTVTNNVTNTTTIADDVTNSSTVSVETLPDTAVSAGTYLAGRTITTGTNGEDITNTLHVTGTVGTVQTGSAIATVTATDSNDSTFSNTSNGEQTRTHSITNSSKNMLNVQKFNLLSDEMKQASMQFIGSIDKLFMNRW